ncbi:hypothetical protein QVA66_08135 [Staphylococcus chromogenes]|nr:hypothetical protein [Staphylococcus chromogenes]
MEQLIATFGPEFVEVNATIADARTLAFRRNIGPHPAVTVTSLGLHPREVACTMLEEDLGAAVATLQVAVARPEPWVPGRVWLNDQPFLGGTLIQALVMRTGTIDEFTALTEEEALVVAENSPSALMIAEARNPLAFADPTRDSYWTAPDLAAIADLPVLTSVLARSAPLRRVEFTEFRRFLATTGEEPADFLANPENIEVRPARELLSKLYGAKTFFIGATPGEAVQYTATGWEFSVT